MRYNHLKLLFLLLFITPELVYACRCRKPEPQTIDNFDAVFIGTVIQGGGMSPAIFRVDEYWKLPTESKEITVSGVLGTCTRYFTLGETYLVYAQFRENGELLQTHICQPGALGKQLKKYKSFLGASKKLKS